MTPATSSPSATAQPTWPSLGTSLISTKATTSSAATAKTQVKPSPWLNAAPGLRISRRLSTGPRTCIGTFGSRRSTASTLVTTSRPSPSSATLPNSGHSRGLGSSARTTGAAAVSASA